MFHYVYVHKDARQAHGLSTWVVLAKVVGRDEARAVPETSPPLVWGPPRTAPAGVRGRGRQRAILHGRDNQPVGTCYEGEPRSGVDTAIHLADLAVVAISAPTHRVLGPTDPRIPLHGCNHRVGS
ncbi:MAG TPA: hypothetical protein VFW33_18720 [Gemmataceae bacterium]|nr:hypothetical protein [Gemmataceae bacterium]